MRSPAAAQLQRSRAIVAVFAHINMPYMTHHEGCMYLYLVHNCSTTYGIYIVRAVAQVQTILCPYLCFLSCATPCCCRCMQIYVLLMYSGVCAVHLLRRGKQIDYCDCATTSREVPAILSEPYHCIPREAWKTMGDAERYLAHLDGRRRRQQDWLGSAY